MPDPHFSNRTTPLCPAILGPTESDIQAMLATLNLPSLDSGRSDGAQTSRTGPSDDPVPRGEIGGAGRIMRDGRAESGSGALIGMGYYDCITPPVIQRTFSRIPVGINPIYPVSSRDRAGRPGLSL